MPRTWNIRVEELTFSRARNAERSQGPGLLVPKKGDGFQNVSRMISSKRNAIADVATER